MLVGFNIRSLSMQLIAHDVEEVFSLECDIEEESRVRGMLVATPDEDAEEDKQTSLLSRLVAKQLTAMALDFEGAVVAPIVRSIYVYSLYQ